MNACKDGSVNFACIVWKSDSRGNVLYEDYLYEHCYVICSLLFHLLVHVYVMYFHSWVFLSVVQWKCRSSSFKGNTTSLYVHRLRFCVIGSSTRFFWSCNLISYFTRLWSYITECIFTCNKQYRSNVWNGFINLTNITFFNNLN